LAVSVDDAVRTEAASGPDLLGALHQRLGVTAETLGLDRSTASDEPAVATSDLYGRLIDHVHADPGTEALWLLMTAMCGAMPEPDEVRAAIRSRAISRPSDFGRWLLEAVYSSSAARGASDIEMDVVTGGVVVDVDFTARHELHTGIQRVVRETIPRWHRAHDMTLVAWTDSDGAMRQLTMFELDRVLRWNDTTRQEKVERRARRRDRLVVPWRSSVLLPENPAPDHCAALTAISMYSGSTVALIGYDCIPLISPELIHDGLPDRFMRYLEPVKHARRVVGISSAATREFRGFVSMLAAQGLQGPTVVECSLPVEVPPGDAVPGTDPPLVVTIGSFEPRKNQLAVLHAAEQLWRDGLEFQLEFIGGGGWPTEFDALFARLRRAGRPVRRRTAVTDEELWRTLRSARFSVFLSLHEGFGLPVAESLACGTPCLTSDYGSTREIADGGGALVADPQDDLAIAEQMRRLLADDELLAQLTEQALQRPPRTWDDYAEELWNALAPVAPGTQEATR
jgi:glycosyltransferase involved in cell wall biosynthesis